MQSKIQHRKVGTDLTQGSILKSLILFALPMILTSLVQQAYSTVDLIVIGQFVGSKGTVGVSTGGELIDLLTPIASALAVGGQVYIAQTVGAKDEGKVKDAIGTLLALMLCISAVCTVGSLVFHKQLLILLNCPEEAMEQASVYMVITACGLPFVFCYNAICGILRGMGESKRPLVFVTVAACANIAVDILFVAIFKLEAAGVAIATILSQFLSFLMSFIYLYEHRDYFDFQLKLSFFKFKRQPMIGILKMGIPQLIRSVAVNSSMAWVKANINSYGLVASATYSVGNKVEKLLHVIGSGIDGATGAMTAQNLGARKTDRAGKVIWIAFSLAMSWGVINGALFLLFPKQLFRVFTPDQDVIDYGVVFLRIMSIGCLVSGFAGSMKSIATGSGAAVLSAIIGLMDGIGRVLVCLLFFYVFKQGAQSYFWGAAFCQLIPGIISLAYFLSGKWKTNKLLSES